MELWKTAAGPALAVVLALGTVSGAAAFTSAGTQFGSDAAARHYYSGRGVERVSRSMVPAYPGESRPAAPPPQRTSPAAGKPPAQHGILPMTRLPGVPATPKKQHGVLPMTRLPGVPETPKPQHGVIQQSRGPTIDPAFLPATVSFDGRYAPGTIVIDTEERYLYLVQSGGTAKRYGVGVGRPGFQWAGTHRVSMKREWPGWTPPPQMRKRQPELPAFMPGGPDNPLGARAMYLGNTLYRIHGSNAPWTIGHEVSSGCIRMRNEDVIELYEMVNVGTKVVVLR